ncbi:MAG: aminotransferase class III-fold pyridoxal phosphate-dependent enzyme [Xenococcus sp. MO_188.B8]|nr:aminotransferase class III-fold pyridoxal phosphate-dependent enzyme [Xenococcus sp. MO_188.B8]
MVVAKEFSPYINSQTSSSRELLQVSSLGIKRDERLTVDSYQYYCRPKLVSLLQALNLDVVYDRAEGDYLWQKQQTQQIKVLDLVGGYGANLLGHHHRELVTEAQRLLMAQIPLLAQGSCRSGAAQLAQALSEIVGDYVTIFTNSGTETIEAAIKHAYLERQRPILWAVKGSFHGKTLGAIQLTWSAQKQFVEFGPQVHYLDPHDPSSWQEASQELDQVAAIFIEPILGEGGIKQQPQDFIDWLLEIKQANDIPLVVDEIQTGMGRTGKFLASDLLGIEPDYLCLSKALGGGLAKIGALMIKRDRLIPDFSVQQTSTFAEDDMSCLIALKALEIIQRDNLPARCARVGDRFLQALEALRTRFPDQIKEVRGQGLMVGIELQDQSESESNALRMFSQNGYLGYMAAAYLLHVHRIRVMPTLSQPLTLRVQPSAYICESELERFVEAVACFCQALKALDIVHLTSFQVGLPAKKITSFTTPRPFKREKPQTEKRVAFLGHFIQADYAIFCEPSLAPLKPRLLEDYLAKTSTIMGPTMLDGVHVRSQTGDKVHLSFIGFNLTSKQIKQAWQARRTDWIFDKIEAAVAMAKQQGCQVVGFGSYTSIVSRNCRRVKTPGIALTTGNSLTVGMGILALQKAAQQRNIELSQSRLAVVGASGNIAATYAAMMAPHVKEIVLIVRHLNSPQLKKAIAKIRQMAPDISIIATDRVDDLRSCSLIVTASNATHPLIYPENLANSPVVICDLSLPADVAPQINRKRPDVLVIKGGIVRLPHNKDFVISGIPLETGHAFACMSETLLMGLEGITSHGSYGTITPEGVDWALSMAKKHGFTLGHFKTQNSY